MGSTDCIEDSIDPIGSQLGSHKRPPTFTPYTQKGPQTKVPIWANAPLVTAFFCQMACRGGNKDILSSPSEEAEAKERKVNEDAFKRAPLKTRGLHPHLQALMCIVLSSHIRQTAQQAVQLWIQ